MLLSELHNVKGEQLDEDLKTAIISAAIGLATVFTPLAQAQDKVEQKFPQVDQVKIDQMVKKTQEIFDNQVDQYMKDNDIKDKSELTAGDLAVIKTKSTEATKKYLISVR